MCRSTSLSSLLCVQNESDEPDLAFEEAVWKAVEEAEKVGYKPCTDGELM